MVGVVFEGEEAGLEVIFESIQAVEDQLVEVLLAPPVKTIVAGQEDGPWRRRRGSTPCGVPRTDGLTPMSESSEADDPFAPKPRTRGTAIGVIYIM